MLQHRFDILPVCVCYALSMNGSCFVNVLNSYFDYT